MQLSRLAAGIPGFSISGDAEVSAVVYDSRKAGPGALFVAVPGLKADGHDFLRAALKAGAAAVAVQRDREPKWRALLEGSGVAYVVLADTRAGLAQLAAAFEGYPARRLGVIGVTGTDGKTSLCHLVDHVLTGAGQRTGLISTAECRIGGAPLGDTGRFTTPEATELQAMLRQIADAGCRWAVIESTSHGLALHRLDACGFDIAAVTTVGIDHLDFHGSPQAYLEAKGRLFEMLGEGMDKGIARTAVLNRDDASYEYLAGVAQGRVLTYGLGEAAEVRAEGLREDGWGWRFRLVTRVDAADVSLGHPGLFNVQNALAAAGIGLAAGLQLAEIAPGIESWKGAPGRMEFIREGQQFTVVVDFAHAAASLRRVLDLLRSRARGRIITVFGCIGEREKDRRFPMGEAAAAGADYTILTDDNPYSEDRMAIIREIAEGLQAAGKREGHDYAIVPDRREAISQALSMAVDEDVVLLAGKGHETEVHLADSVYECDDRELARRIIRELL
jgi:UDP-N-acetylmuramoyl-L-alanyl-D-glutamate--2,6-diaminopimelate ligase